MTGDWGEARPAGITAAGGSRAPAVLGARSGAAGMLRAEPPVEAPRSCPVSHLQSVRQMPALWGFGVETDTATPVTAGLKLPGGLPREVLGGWQTSD